MQSLHFQKLLRKFKEEKLERSHKFPLLLDNISINIPLPKLQLFTEPTIVEYDTIYESKKKSDLITNECFYSDGILGNIYNIHDCDKYWLLSFCTAVHFRDNFSDNIKCFVMGYKTPTIINGLYHYCNNSKFGKNNQLSLQWMGMGFDAYKVPVSKEYKNNILRGFTQDDLCNHDNLSHIKRSIENKMGNINMLYNNISPESDHRILLSASVLVMTSMPFGIFISKIPEPNNWNDNFINYLLLFALLFNNTDICRFPVSTKNTKNTQSVLSFQYFLICHDRKKILHKITAYRKILTYMKKCEILNSDILNFTDDIIGEPGVDQWRTNVMNIKQKYIQADQCGNPQVNICEILDTIKDIICADVQINTLC
jgi:hypothetical protein